MKVSYNWLKEYVDFELSPDELAHRLTMAGLEVAGVEQIDDGAILELEITPNRGDCLSMIGVAREISLLTSSPFRPPRVQLAESNEEIGSLIQISVMEQELCPRYTARMIKGIEVGPSPDWLKGHLLADDIRPINNVVDVTNYILLELGQPMHAFDCCLLMGGKLIIRRARQGESITALDGITHKLNEDMLIIADISHPVAIAGIIGGESTQVTPKTRDVLLEGAYFDHVLVRRMSRSLGVSTGSSFRFERGIDPDGLPLAQDRAAQLIKELAGGEIVNGMIDIYPEPVERPRITLHKERVNKVLGTDLSLPQIMEILARLGFSFQSPITNHQSPIIIEVPSFRHEITREIDLIEEIARIYGYEKIDLALPNKTTLVSNRRKDQITKRTREILVGLGLYEVITYAFIDRDILKKLSLDPTREMVVISNPLSEETSLMRTTLIPGLIKTVLRNINMGVKNIKIFEIGCVFRPKEDEALPEERCCLGAALTGHYQEPSWRRRDEGIGFYELAGVIERLFEGLGIKDYRLVEGRHPSLCPGRTARIETDEETIGIMGEMDPDILTCLDLPAGVSLFEIEFDKILALSNLDKNYRPLPRYPAATRDLAILVKDEIPSSEVLEIIKEIGGRIIERAELFDFYPAEKISEEYRGFKSLAYSIRYRDQKGTLKDDFINEIHTRIVSALEERLGARLR